MPLTPKQDQIPFKIFQWIVTLTLGVMMAVIGSWAMEKYTKINALEQTQEQLAISNGKLEQRLVTIEHQLDSIQTKLDRLMAEKH